MHHQILRRALAAPAAVLLAASVLAGCGGDQDAAQAPQQAGQSQAAPSTAQADIDALLARHDLGEKDVPAIIETLETTDDDKEAGLVGSIRQDVLLLKDEEGEVAVPMPADRTYVSIAPYAQQTHECHWHNLATCQGEMTGADVRVTVTDDSGATLVDEETTTWDNGFVGVWLPRDVQGEVAIEADGKTATAPLATGAEDPTCVTTIQVA